MAKLIYIAIASLDGYVADAAGNFDWSAPSDEVHAFVNDLERPIGTMLLGRRMYDVLKYWETAPTGPDEPFVMRDFAAIWRAADKLVYSQTLDAVSTTRTRLERYFEPDVVRRQKAAATRDLTVGGPALAAQALEASLVDECHLFLSPVTVGGGTPALPPGHRARLDLLDDRRFANGVVYLRYAVLPRA